jgi:hypothetical protein
VPCPLHLDQVKRTQKLEVQFGVAEMHIRVKNGEGKVKRTYFSMV